MKDSKELFSDRVEQYQAYRPGYPEEALRFLYEALDFASAALVADIGSGTGIFTRALLERGSAVVAVEPNREMRRAAEAALSGYPGFRSVDGAAEATTLGDGSVDRIVSAQAFHWFDIPGAKREFARILKPDGIVALVWNRRRTDAGPFAEAYERLLRTYGREYERVNHTNLKHEDFASFFRDGAYEKRTFAHRQTYDKEGLKGRTMSSSYCPLPGESNFEPMMAELERLFDETQRDGVVAFDYATDIFYGKV